MTERRWLGLAVSASETIARPRPTTPSGVKRARQFRGCRHKRGDEVPWTRGREKEGEGNREDEKKKQRWRVMARQRLTVNGQDVS